MPMLNPGLVAAIHNALSETNEAEPAGLVLNAAIHGWFEGHIDGESQRRTPSPASSQAFADIDEDAFPSPPFPDRKSPELGRLLRESKERFALPSEAPAAVAYAAALGWAAGFREGQKCHGCSYRGPEPELAEIMRGGGIPLELPTARAMPSRQRASTRTERQVEIAEALEFTLAALGHNLRAARKHAGYTQLEIARKLKTKLATVRGSEAGKVRVPATYVAHLLRVCGLPRGWKAPR